MRMLPFASLVFLFDVSNGLLLAFFLVYVRCSFGDDGGIFVVHWRQDESPGEKQVSLPSLHSWPCLRSFGRRLFHCRHSRIRRVYHSRRLPTVNALLLCSLALACPFLLLQLT